MTRPRARLWVRVTVGLIRALEAVSRRLTDPSRRRCPWTGGKHVFVRYHDEPYASCGCGRSQFA